MSATSLSPAAARATDLKHLWRPEMEGKEHTGAEIFVECLIREGVDVIFAYPGGVVLNIFDEFHARGDEIKLIVPRHEQAGGHAADGLARVTGKVATAMATSGPGATNLVTAIATAHMDSIPVVFFTGQVSSGLLGSDAFQEANSIGMTLPMVKHSYLLESADDIARVIREAYHIAGSGRPGPVLVDIPKDVTINKAMFHWQEEVDIRGYKPKTESSLEQVKQLAAAIEQAEKPYLYVGGGVVLSEARDELMELVDRTNIPVTTTLMALGAIPGTHPLFVGMPGMHGSKLANIAFQECDLIVSVGARFDDRVTGKLDAFAPNAKIAHVDIDPSSIKKIIKVDYPVVGDAKWVLTELNKIVKPRQPNGWNEKIAKMKKSHWFNYDRTTDVIHPQYVVEKLWEMTKERDTIICTEVGQIQMWAAQFYLFDKPRRWLTSGGLGTMGYGFPAAIGAQFACPEALVIDVAGDASIQMNIQELATVVEHNMPVKIVILNNGYMGMVRQWQEFFFERHYAGTDTSLGPNFAKVAEAFGARGLTAKSYNEVTTVLQEGIAHNGPVVMDFHVNREENVYPMVPAGAALHEMRDGEWA